MKAWARMAACLAVAISTSAFAQEPGDLTRAIQPLVDGVPQVSVVRLRALLAGKLADGERQTATIKLGEALRASDEADEALNLLSDASVQSLPETTFLRAQALASLGRWSEALPFYEQSGSGAAARFGAAEALRALGRSDEALQALNSLTRDPLWSVRAQFVAAEVLLAKNDLAAAKRLIEAVDARTAAERKERRLLRGRIEWQANRSHRAIEMFASILRRPEGATHPVLMATLCAIADANLEMKTPGTGDDYLEHYIEHHPTDPGLALVFAKLDQLYAAERRQSRHELGRWTRDPAQPRRAFSFWYLARAEMRLGDREAARATFARLRADHPPLPELAPAFLEYAEMELRDGRNVEAQAFLESARALRPAAPMLDRINFMGARAQYAARQFDRAATSFQQMARAAVSPGGKDALFNASLAWLSAGDAAQATGIEQELKNRGADEETRGDLALEQGLIAATNGDKTASEALQKFNRDYPKHPRVSEAWVALAELAFHATPPRIEEARQDLARAAENHPTAAANERAHYLSIWLEEGAATPNDQRMVELATQFVQKYGSSSLLPDVRLKLAEAFYRRQDFASAQTQFEILAQQNTSGPVAEKAQFFAAKSAMQSMGEAALDRALVLFDQVVKRNGELKWAARNEQAVIERKLGKPDDAMTLYDEVLKGDAKPAEKREALCGKGDILYELGAANAENYRRAIDLYSQLAADREASPHWRNQAIFKKGMCLEKLDAPADALTTFYGIVEDESRPDRRREFFWFYKAGFNAARLLEEQSKWRAAAAIYEKLSFAGGARSEEAKSRLNRLRLEHFLWED